MQPIICSNCGYKIDKNMKCDCGAWNVHKSINSNSSEKNIGIKKIEKLYEADMMLKNPDMQLNKLVVKYNEQTETINQIIDYLSNKK